MALKGDNRYFAPFFILKLKKVLTPAYGCAIIGWPVAPFKKGETV
jgi:hypothetical protein